MKTEHGPVTPAGSSAVARYWALSIGEVLNRTGSSERGLDSVEAARKLAEAPVLRGQRRIGWLPLLLKQFTSPIIVILLVATAISMAVGDLTDGGIIVAIIVASGLLGFWQDHRANRDVAALMARIQVMASVLRDGEVTAVPVSHVVEGDIVELNAGDVVPADCRLLQAQSLLVDESSLTGESFPVEKDADVVLAPEAALSERTTIVLFGTHVVSGTARAVAAATGRDTELGQISHDLRSKTSATTFERGVSQFGYLLVRFMIVLTAAIFGLNYLLGRPLIDSLLFSLSLAVGLTPQMLPAIVTVSLATGARRMAVSRVIVKHLDAIEDLGAMTVLCTDKTGTLTVGAPGLDLAIDLVGTESEEVLSLAALNAGLQDGFDNPMDDAILARRRPEAGAVRLAQVPYDFGRKRLSVLTDVAGTPTLIVKGALQQVVAVCTHASTAAGIVAMGEVAADVQSRFEDLSGRGYRVLGLATKRYDADPAGLSTDAESEMTLVGMLAFHDPVKPGVADAVRDLGALGVSLRLVTGDNSLAACAAARNVGIDAARVLSGPQLDTLDDTALAAAVAEVTVFAEVEPAHKRRLVLALRAGGAGVGFLGDGINDAPALHAADVGISVDTAVDVAKEAAAVVLLDKELSAVVTGVRLGRQTFANTLKYARATTSANFGNMLSLATVSLFLSFLPLLPRQILLLNFLSDIPSTAIAGDAVDTEQVLMPAAWHIRDLRRFMLVFGGLSTLFDLATFAVLLWGFDVDTVTFRSAWFIESTLTELAVLFALRTTRPLYRSRPSRVLVMLSALVALVVVAIPFIPALAVPLGLDALSSALMLSLAGIILAYVAANELVKRVYFREERRAG